MFDSKIFNGEVFGKYVERVPDLKRNELLKSGVLRSRQDLVTMLDEQTGGNRITIPMKGLLDGDVLNYDGSTDITATSTDTFSQTMIVTGRAKAWVEKDFSFELTGVDFMDNVAVQVSKYFENVDQDTLIAILKGIFAMSDEGFAKHSYDITGEETNNTFAPTTLNTACNRALGQNKGIIRVLIMHSDVATNLENLRLLEYLKYTDKDGITRDLALGTLNGRVVLIDDSMPIEEVAESTDGAGDGYTAYTTYALGEGAFDYCNCGAKVPYEMDRDPAKNGGQDTLYTRQRKLFAPKGISWKGATSIISPTAEQLSTGTNWEIVHNGKTSTNKKYFNHKSIPIVQIKTRG